MPVYVFECKKCGKIFELLMSMNSTAEATCPSCGSKDVTKCITAPAMVNVKGSSTSSSSDSSGSCPLCNLGRSDT